MSAEASYPFANALVESNIREAKTIDPISILSSATSSNRDTYANILVTVASLTAELMLANKNLVEALRENTRMERVLCQFQKHTSTSGGGVATGRGDTSQHKKRAHYCWSCRYDVCNPSSKCIAK